jgi:TetR/AcrR family transcriptional repressor of nem operon
MGNREKLLSTATAIFGKRGYQATSVDHILGEAGVSPSNFYYHFRSKEKLAYEVLERTFQATRQEIAPLFMNRRLRPAEKLEHLHRLFVQKMAQNGCRGGCPLGNLAQELSDSHPGFRQRLAEFFGECMDGIALVVSQGIKAGEFRRDIDPKSAAYLLFGSLEGLLLLCKSLKEVAPLERGFRQALALLREKK